MLTASKASVCVIFGIYTHGIPCISSLEPLSFCTRHCRNIGKKLTFVLPSESEDKFTMAPSLKTGKGKTIPSLNIRESTGKNKIETLHTCLFMHL